MPLSNSVRKRYQCLPWTERPAGAYLLRAVQPEDIESIRLWRNAQMDVLRQSAPIEPDAQRRYFAENVWPQLELTEPMQILLAIERDGLFVGYGGLVHVAWNDQRAEVSFLLDPDCADGYAEVFGAFLDALKSVAFDDLGLHRLFTETYAHRTAHIAILEQAGFEREGVLRDHVRISGNPVDSILHGCLR